MILKKKPFFKFYHIFFLFFASLTSSQILISEPLQIIHTHHTICSQKNKCPKAEKWVSTLCRPMTLPFSHLFSELQTMGHKQFAKWPGSNFIHVYETVKNSCSAFLQTLPHQIIQRTPTRTHSISGLTSRVLKYCKVASSNTSSLEANAGFFQIAYEGDSRSLYIVTFWQKVDFLISNAC